MAVIQESGMQFGEYAEEQIFHLEKSIQYTESLMSNGIKSCEFILRRGNKLYFVEAKSSCPRYIGRFCRQPCDRLTVFLCCGMAVISFYFAPA